MPKATLNGAVIAASAACAYRTPRPDAVEIADHAAFYPVVTIEFYELRRITPA